jgi:drug/metabolite transporter (DMT)-like permease
MEWYFYSLIAAVFFAGSMIIEKRALLKEHALEMCTVLSIFIFGTYSAIFFSKVKFPLNQEALFLIFTVSILATFGFWYLAKGMRHMEVSETSPLLNFSPAFVAVWAYIFLGETLKTIQITGIIVLVAGSYLLEVKNPLKHPLKPLINTFKSKYTQYIFLALIMYSFVYIIDKIVIAKTDVITYLFFVQLFMMINYIILINILHDGFKGIKHGIKSAGKWIFLLAILFIGRRIFYLTSVSMIQVSIAFPIYRMGTILSTMIGGKIFHDKHILSRTLACILMVIGATLIII